MDLNVVTPADAKLRQDLPPPKQAKIQTDPDDWYQKLIKFIPVPIVGAYLAIQGIVPELADSPNVRRVLLWSIFAILGFLTWVYLWSREVRRLLQVSLSVVAYVVWVFALGGPFRAQFDWWEPWMGSIAVILTAVAFISFNFRPLPEDESGG